MLRNPENRRLGTNRPKFHRVFLRNDIEIVALNRGNRREDGNAQQARFNVS
jgi:hypothetical protein